MQHVCEQYGARGRRDNVVQPAMARILDLQQSAIGDTGDIPLWIEGGLQFALWLRIRKRWLHRDAALGGAGDEVVEFGGAESGDINCHDFGPVDIA